MKIITKAPAKVNLALEVLGRRPDGYHEITTVFQMISLADEIAFSNVDDDTVTPPASPAVSSDEHSRRKPPTLGQRSVSPMVGVTGEGVEIPPNENLVVRAARLLQLHTDKELPPVVIDLHKRIPVAAGLGGGSSDGAATLRALNALWSLGLSGAALVSLAAQLGSDAPFFVQGGTALATGRGELLTPLRSPLVLWLVILTPPQRVPEKTKLAYARLNASHYSAGERTRRLAADLSAGRSPHEDVLFNAFEGVASSLFPGIGSWRKRVERVLGKPTHLAGAGPSVFALFDRQEEAEKAAQMLDQEDAAVFLARSIDQVPVLHQV